MSYSSNLRFLCCLWLCLCAARSALGQDIRPEFPEDFTTTSAKPAATTTSIELPTTTARTTTEAGTTTTTEDERVPPTRTTTTTTTTTRTTELPTEPPTVTPPSYLPTPSTGYYYPPYNPPTRPHVPVYDCPEYEDNSSEELCYLKNQLEYSYYWIYGHSSKQQISCYRCCVSGHNRFAGCSKLHTGYCTISSYVYLIR
ncbi:hypothetical protein KR222_001147 [Zaprionus bogoriensis]|nr:hypothetical protein KR222_001147 [Zaprionus bogoriensis]